jgi:hypothetical protein
MLEQFYNTKIKEETYKKTGTQRKPTDLTNLLNSPAYKMIPFPLSQLSNFMNIPTQKLFTFMHYYEPPTPPFL